MLKIIATKPIFCGVISSFYKNVHHKNNEAIFILIPAIKAINCNYYSNEPKKKCKINPLTKSLTLLSLTETKYILENSTGILKLCPYPERKEPLVVMMAWLMSKPEYVYKYAQLYLQLGFNVLTVSFSPTDLLWPVSGSQVVAKDLLGFLDTNSIFSPLLIHGFSSGGYIWGELLTHVEKDPERYSIVMHRISGHIWDSFAELKNLQAGFSYGMFSNHPTLGKIAEIYLNFHRRTFTNSFTQHLVRGCENFYNNRFMVKSPALLMASRTDKVGKLSNTIKLKESWDKLGMTTYIKIWDESPHVEHYRYNPEEYKAQLKTFLSKIQFLPPA